MNEYDIFDSPLGQVTALAGDRGLTGLHLEGDKYFRGVPAVWVQNPDNPLLRQAKLELEEYFARRRHRFSVALAPAGTPFQQQVWEALGALPFGARTTYRGLATQIGRPTAARAVGSAIGRNPICVIVPCHRVIASDGSLGGYVAGIERKQTLLELEGADS